MLGSRDTHLYTYSIVFFFGYKNSILDSKLIDIKQEEGHLRDSVFYLVVIKALFFSITCSLLVEQVFNLKEKKKH